MRRFIVVADEPSAEAQNKVTNEIRALGSGYWHWFQGTWMIVDRDDSRDARWWRDTLKLALTEANFIVFEDKESDWAGYGPPTVFQWIHENWKDPPPDPANPYQLGMSK